jgi:hypothetical protein
MTDTLITCPCCNGTGQVKRSLKPYRRYTDDEVATAKKMRADGHTLGEIGKALGIDHTQKVQHLLNRKET